MQRYSDFVLNEALTNIFKGILKQIFDVFGAPFKELAKDFKDLFKEDDPNSIKTIILNVFNQAIDNAQKRIPQVKTDADINAFMSDLVLDLVDLSNNMSKDISSVVNKDKSAGAIDVANAILFGNKQANWQGIIGLLDPTKGKSGLKGLYKYSVSNYLLDMSKAGKMSGDSMKNKIKAANLFLDGLQKDIVNQINKDFTEEEIKKIYYEHVKNTLTKGVGIIYLKKGVDKASWDGLSDEEKKNVDKAPASEFVNIGTIDSINGDKYVIAYGNKGEKTIKTRDEILDVHEKENETQPGNDVDKLKNVLGELKNNREQIDDILLFSEFVKKGDKEKIDQIKQIMK